MANNLTGGGTVAYTAAGKFGAALSGGRGTVANFLPTNGVFTWDGWVKSTNSGAIRVAFSVSNTAWVGCDASGKAQARYGSGANEVVLTTTISITDSVFHHVELDFSASGASLYVDGVLAASNVKTLSAAGATYTDAFGISTLGVAPGTYDWPGIVDEVAVWTTTLHTAAFTPPTAAYANTSTGILALYHLDNDLTDSAGLVATPTAVTLSLSAASGVVGSPVTVTVGTNQPLTGVQSESVALTSNVAGAFSPASVMLNSTTATATATFTPSAAGTATITGTATGTPTLTNGTATYTVNASSNNALVTANVLWSPYNWNLGPNTAKTINSGAYFRTVFGGTTCTLQFDLTNLAGLYPQISYRIDGFGPWINVVIAASITLTLPTDTAGCANAPGHYLEFVVKSTSQAQSRWSPQATAISLTGIILDAGKVLIKPPALPLSAIYYGDSITEGIRTANASANDTDWGDAAASAAYLSAKILGAEVGMVGFGASGWVTAGAGGVPTFPNSYNLIYAGVSRSFAVAPDFIVINHGTNDGAANVTTAVTTALNALIAATPATTKIIALRPYNGSGATFIQNGIAATTTPSRVTYVDTTGWFTTANSADNLHPYGTENLFHIAPLMANAILPVISLTKGTRTARTITGTLVDATGTPQASLTGLKWSIHDQATPDVQSVVSDSGTTTTNASGVFSFTALTTKASGGTVWLDITNSDGTTAQTAGKAYSGPVAVA